MIMRRIFTLILISIIVLLSCSILYANQSITSIKEEADNNFDNGYYEKAAELYKELLYNKKIPLKLGAYISYKIGRCYEILDDLEKSASYYYNSLQINKELLNKDAVSILYFRLGNVLERSNRIEDSIIAFKNSYTISKDLNNDKIRAHSAYRLGILLYFTGNNPSSLRYFMVSLKIHMANENLKNAGVIAYYLGKIYYEEGRIDEAIHILKISINVLKKAGSDEWRIVEQTLNSIE